MAPKFSLQSVLDYRHSRVEALEMEFARLNEARQQGLQMQAGCQAELEQVFEQLKAQQNGDLDLFAIQHLSQDARSLEDQLEQIRQALGLLDEQIEAKRLEIVAARQAEETLNTLKDKGISEWEAEQAMIENRQQDNIYIAQAFHRANGSAHA